MVETSMIIIITQVHDYRKLTPSILRIPYDPTLKRIKYDRMKSPYSEGKYKYIK